MVTVPTNTYGIDFLAAYPNPTLLWDRGVRFVAIYLKNWSPDWVTQWLALGGAVVPIGEITADRAAGGAALGAADAAHWVTLAQHFGVPANNTVPIVLTADSSAWDPVQHPAYFAAAQPVLRAAGYLIGGYGGRKMIDDSANAGVKWDLIWATNAWSWLGGRHPDRHVEQGGHSSIRPELHLYNGTPLDVTGMGLVDTNVSRRAFPAWTQNTLSTPAPAQGADMATIVTNKEQFFTSAPNVAKFVLMDNGQLRHLAEPEWHALGSPAGYPFSNAEIGAQGVWATPAGPAAPVHYAVTLTGTANPV